MEQQRAAPLCCPLVAASHISLEAGSSGTWHSRKFSLLNYKDLMLLRTYRVPSTDLGAGTYLRALPSGACIAHGGSWRS